MDLGSFLGGGAIGGTLVWLVQKLLERRWAHQDRRTERAEADQQEKLRLLRELNGDLYNKWLWLADHPDAANQATATPAANEIGSWLYKYSAYFPEAQRPTMVVLAGLTFNLATNLRPQMLTLRHTLFPQVWQQLRDYQREVEAALGLAKP
jgi:hypothetical protein